LLPTPSAALEVRGSTLTHPKTSHHINSSCPKIIYVPKLNINSSTSS
jgi:hypothetical protein